MAVLRSFAKPTFMAILFVCGAIARAEYGPERKMLHAQSFGWKSLFHINTLKVRPVRAIRRQGTQTGVHVYPDGSFGQDDRLLRKQGTKARVNVNPDGSFGEDDRLHRNSTPADALSPTSSDSHKGKSLSTLEHGLSTGNNCCGDKCQSGNDCFQGLICCPGWKKCMAPKPGGGFSTGPGSLEGCRACKAAKGTASKNQGPQTRPERPPDRPTVPNAQREAKQVECSFETERSVGSAWCGLWEPEPEPEPQWIRGGHRTPSGEAEYAPTSRRRSLKNRRRARRRVRKVGPYNAKEGNYYMYMEASDTPSAPRKPGVAAKLFTKNKVQIKNKAYLEFEYYMFGEDMGKLQVWVGGKKEFEVSGNQGMKWIAVYLDLKDYAGQSQQIKFVGIRGNSWKGDIAIDDIDFNPGT